MKNILAIVERELRAYFASPVAYVVLTIFVLLSGVFFQTILRQIVQMATVNALQSQQFGAASQPIDMPGLISQSFLGTLSVVLLFMLPMITMGLFSEEKKRGTIELLLTAPITDFQVVMGKYLAAVSFYAIMLATTWVPTSVLFLYGDPAWGPILSGYLGTVALRGSPVGRGPLHLDAYGESDRRRCVEFWHHSHAVDGGRGRAERYSDHAGRIRIPFDTGTPGRIHTRRRDHVTRHLLSVAHDVGIVPDVSIGGFHALEGLSLERLDWQA